MPYKFETDKLKIPHEKDRRVKLTQEQREEIKELYGKISQRKLAKLYGVSRRLIIFIGRPETLERNLQLRQLRGGSMNYYKKEKNTKAIKKTRTYKYSLYTKGKLKQNEKK